MKVLYFAWVREGVGRDGESIDFPSSVLSVADAIRYLAGLDAAHAAVLGDPARLRAAVDGRFALPDTSIAGAGELAIFPPVTGG